MNVWQLIRRSLTWFRRTNVGVVLGAACATAVLVGALAVGDSVRSSLRGQAENRVGRVDAALVLGERFCVADLADRLAARMPGVTVAPLLRLGGIARAAGGARAGIVGVHGVDARFFALGPQGPARAPPRAGQAFLDARLAEQLHVGAGDAILLRVDKPSRLPKDLALAAIDDVSFALRVAVSAVLSDAEFGRFSLRASQVPPFNVFLELAWLQEQLALAGRANMLLAGGPDPAPVVTGRANESLPGQWTLADAEFEVRPLAGSGLVELVSARVFLDQPVVAAVARIEPSALGVLTYFVNELRKGERATPYSMVSAIGPLAAGGRARSADLAALLELPGGPAGIVLNEWCARDLGAAPGDRVELAYYVMGPNLRLVTREHAFQVARVVPIEGAAADRSLMPAFPGLADAENCRDWEPGVPIDLDRIRDVDEKYWDDHRGTPKAFVTLETGQALWANRFGNLTAVRGPEELAARLPAELPRAFDLARIGFFFRDVRTPALAASTPATDFGGLFLGLSFFLIFAAVLLTSLLFAFGVEQRANEIGALLALGFRPRQVRRLFVAEALVLAAIGGALGVGLGLGYTRAVLWGLGTLWRDAVGTTTLTFHASVTTVLAGALLAILAAALAIRLALRKTFHHPAVELLKSRGGIPGHAAWQPRRTGLSLAAATLCVAGALGLVLAVGPGSAQAAGAFFGGGALLLAGGMFACRYLLHRFAGAGRPITSIAGLGVRNTGRRPGRSLATIALLASGTFLVVAVQANRLAPPPDPAARDSGTGGFALFGRATLPVLRDLETAAGREAYGLEESQLAGAAIVPLRVQEGDDASCLNLSLPQNPRLLGVRPAALAERGAFRFADVLAPASGDRPPSPWWLLERDFGSDVVPAIGDQASITWTLHKKVGDTIDYRDEQGRVFGVRLVASVANSILQGNLVVAERHLERRFPSASGYRMFLIDAPAERAAQVSRNLTRALADIGFELTSTSDRLRQFSAVQNTYLLIFQALGGLGLLLGSLGLGMVVLRNALERRSELALASAVGFPTDSIRRLLWNEHGLLLGLGLISGILAAMLAVVPALRGTGEGLAVAPMILLVGAVALSGALWVWLASLAATRGPLATALRDE